MRKEQIIQRRSEQPRFLAWSLFGTCFCVGAGTLAAQPSEPLQLWRSGEIERASSAAVAVLDGSANDGEARAVKVLSHFLVGDYEAALAHFKLLDLTDGELPEMLRSELARLMVDAYDHLARHLEAAAQARVNGASSGRLAFLERRAAAPFSATLERTTVVPFAVDNFLGELMPAVPGRIDGEAASLHLDTGGAFLAVSPEKAATLGVELVEVGTGVAANQRTEIAMGLVDRLEIGEAVYRNVPLAAVSALSEQSEPVRDMVIVGTRLLSPFLVTWDNRAGRLVLSPNDEESRREHFDRYAADAEPFRFYLARDHYLWARGAVGERDVLFFVDTGLVTLDEEGKQPALTTARAELESWGLAPGEARFVSAPGPIRLGNATGDDHSIMVGADYRNLATLAGLRPSVLVAHGFLKRFVWTIDFEERTFRLEPIAESPAETATDQATIDLEPYAGSYALAPGVALEVKVADGRLLLRAPGQGWVPMTVGEADDTFEIKAAAAVIRFERGTEGTIEVLVLQQAGFEQRALRSR